MIRVIKDPDSKTTDSKTATSVYTQEGEVINSFQHNGLSSNEFREVVTDALEKEKKGNRAKTYKIRDQIFSRQRYWGKNLFLSFIQKTTILSRYQIKTCRWNYLQCKIFFLLTMGQVR